MNVLRIISRLSGRAVPVTLLPSPNGWLKPIACPTSCKADRKLYPSVPIPDASNAVLSCVSNQTSPFTGLSPGAYAKAARSPDAPSSVKATLSSPTWSDPAASSTSEKSIPSTSSHNEKTVERDDSLSASCEFTE